MSINLMFYLLCSNFLIVFNTKDLRLDNSYTVLYIQKNILPIIIYILSDAVERHNNVNTIYNFCELNAIHNDLFIINYKL